MQGLSLGGLLSRRWMLLVAVLVVAVAGFAVYRLNGIFGSHDVTSTPSGDANEIVPFNPKRVVMEVSERPGNTATITYPGRERPTATGRGRDAAAHRHRRLLP
jgi:hypothetical protein